MVGARLKEHNAGGAIPLLATDLFRLSCFPLSTGVHQVKILGSPAGAIEYGEYVIRQGASHFNHSRLQLSDDEFAQVQERLVILARHPSSPPVPEEEEEPTRRSIHLWASGERRAYHLAAPASPASRRLSVGLTPAFEAAWRAIIEPIERRRSSDLGVGGRDA